MGKIKVLVCLTPFPSLGCVSGSNNQAFSGFYSASASGEKLFSIWLKGVRIFSQVILAFVRNRKLTLDSTRRGFIGTFNKKVRGL